MAAGRNPQKVETVRLLLQLFIVAGVSFFVPFGTETGRNRHKDAEHGEEEVLWNF